MAVKKKPLPPQHDQHHHHLSQPGHPPTRSVKPTPQRCGQSSSFCAVKCGSTMPVDVSNRHMRLLGLLQHQHQQEEAPPPLNQSTTQSEASFSSLPR